MMPSRALELSVPRSQMSVLNEALEGWLSRLGLKGCSTKSSGWEEATGGRWRRVCVAGGAARIEWEQAAAGVRSRALRVWRFVEGDAARLVVHLDEGAGATPLPVGVEALGAAVCRAASVAADGLVMGQVHAPRAEEVERLVALLKDPARTRPAVVTQRDDVAQALVAEIGSQLHVSLLTGDSREEFNQRVEGFHRLLDDDRLVHFFGIGGMDRVHGHWRGHLDGARFDRLSGHVVARAGAALWTRRVVPAVDAEVEAHLLDLAVAERTRALVAVNAGLKARLEAASRAGVSQEAAEVWQRLAEEYCLQAETLTQELVQEQERVGALRQELAQERAKVQGLKAALGQQLAAAGRTAAEVAAWDFEGLERVSGGALVFTANARKTWEKERHPHAEALWGALVGLCAAADEYRACVGEVGEALPLWLRERLGKECPFDDAGLVQNALDQFEFEGATYSRVSHVKVKDHCAFPEVARIYFAVDPAGLRFVIDHVGKKLYNPF